MLGVPKPLARNFKDKGTTKASSTTWKNYIIGERRVEDELQEQWDIRHMWGIISLLMNQHLEAIWTSNLEGPRRWLPPFKGEHLNPYMTQGFIVCRVHMISTNLTKSLDHGLKYLWVWNFIQFINFYQGENKNIPKRTLMIKIVDMYLHTRVLRLCIWTQNLQ